MMQDSYTCDGNSIWKVSQPKNLQFSSKHYTSVGIFYDNMSPGKHRPLGAEGLDQYLARYSDTHVENAEA